MSTPLTREEQKKIIELYQEGKSNQEIRDITGRSREAQTALLTRVGLHTRGAFQTINRKAYHMFYMSEDYKSTKYKWDHNDFHPNRDKTAPFEIRQKYLKAARKECEDKFREAYESIMFDSPYNKYNSNIEANIVSDTSNIEELKTEIQKLQTELNRYKEENQHLKSLLTDKWSKE